MGYNLETKEEQTNYKTRRELLDMKKRSMCLLLCLVLVFSLGSYAMAVDAAQNDQALPASDSLAIHDGPYYLVNGVAVADPGMTNINGVTYVSLQTALTAIYPDVSITWPSEKALITASGFTMRVGIGDRYVEANGRALYVLNGVQSSSGRVIIPIRILAQAVGGYVTWEAESGISALYSGTLVASGESYYSADDLHWLSRIINAESGGEPLDGKLAVGTVVLNRVESAQFPNSIYEVVFDRRGGVWQFTPAGSGAVYREPNEESVLAAKLCLEGVRVGDPSLYFVNQRTSPNSWASRNRPYVATIGHHTFFA